MYVYMYSTGHGILGTKHVLRTVPTFIMGGTIGRSILLAVTIGSLGALSMRGT